MKYWFTIRACLISLFIWKPIPIKRKYDLWYFVKGKKKSLYEIILNKHLKKLQMKTYLDNSLIS